MPLVVHHLTECTAAVSHHIRRGPRRIELRFPNDDATTEAPKFLKNAESDTRLKVCHTGASRILTSALSSDHIQRWRTWGSDSIPSITDHQFFGATSYSCILHQGFSFPILATLDAFRLIFLLPFGIPTHIKLMGGRLARRRGEAVRFFRRLGK